MRYLTPLKRAEGRGASRTGTEHHWFMQVSSVGLALTLPPFIFIIGRALGQPHEAVVETLGRPFPAILTAIVLVLGLRHFARGVQMAIEDYSHGTARHTLVILSTLLSYGLMAAGLFALARIAL